MISHPTRRAVFTAALTAYATALALAAIPPEVRPRAIADVADAARVALRAVGIRPGVAVFESATTPTTRIVRNDCIALRVRDAGGRVRTIAPPDDRCVTRGARLTIPWTEGLLRSVVLRAPPGVAEAALGDWACHAPRFAALAPAEVEIEWDAAWIDRASGAEGVERNALVRWRCAPPGVIERRIDAASGGR